MRLTLRFLLIATILFMLGDSRVWKRLFHRPAGFYIELPAHTSRSMCGDFDVIVLQISKENLLTINSESVPREALAPRINDIYRLRAERLLLIRADPNLTFQDVAKTIDVARGGRRKPVRDINHARRRERHIERWLKAPMQEEDGRLVPREKGTPQGEVASPLLANLFLHYAFDQWLATNYPQVVFERFADDVIVHCRTEGEALAMRKAIAERLQNCGLELHPEKTKIVYCKDDDWRRTYRHEKFNFLGKTRIQ
jgi:Reverse transcriptase (RNA-dependent DNA polymerase)